MNFAARTAYKRLANSDSDWYPQVAGSMIVWRNSGDEDALIIARAGDPVVTQTVNLRIIGDTTNEADENFFLHIEAASSESQIEIIKSTSEIMILMMILTWTTATPPDSYYPTLVSNDAPGTSPQRGLSLRRFAADEPCGGRTRLGGRRPLQR